MERTEVNLSHLLFGRRLANKENEQKKIGWIEGVPAMGLDGLGSSSYGPEAALTILIPLGAAGIIYMGPVIGLIVVLLAILYFSYRQTIRAYPSNGGAYTVAKENLGENFSLLAAAALMIDYVLNVAVGVSAGAGALVSALPALHPFILPICLAIVLFVTIANLRGTGEAGWLFAVPTYIFIACFLGVIGWGVFQTVITGGQPHPAVPPQRLEGAGGAVSLWLLMQAFAAGCTAMTGVEAVSNGVGSFKDPVEKNAFITLTIIVVVLGLLLGGIATLSISYHVGAMHQETAGYQSVVSQLLEAVVGRGPIYFIGMASLLCVLCLSANTSFVGFPRLARMVAADGFLPRSFAIPGRRLVFNAGILFLSGLAALLLVVFGGITDHLIPLFAIGAFLTFTISQAGMVLHWRKQQGRNHGKLIINLVGAISTGAALAIIICAKFFEGAWITVLAVPLLIWLLKSIHHYYVRLEDDLAPTGPLHLDRVAPPTVIVVAESWSKLSERAIKFALTISPDVVAVHLNKLDGPEDDEEGKQIRERWVRDVETPVAALGLTTPRLMTIPAPYRKIDEPLLKLIDRLDAEAPERAVAVLIPQTVKVHWWQTFLHTRRAARLRSILLKSGRPNLTVISVPWRLTEGLSERAKKRASGVTASNSAGLRAT